MKRSSFGSWRRWIGLDAVARELERIQRRGIAGLDRGLDLGGRDAKAGCIQRQPVELCRGLEQGRVAALGHVVDDGARGGLDIGRDLALGGEEGRKSLVKIGAAAVETNGHFGLASAGLDGAGYGLTGPLLNGAAGSCVNPWGDASGERDRA